MGVCSVTSVVGNTAYKQLEADRALFVGFCQNRNILKVLVESTACSRCEINSDLE